MRDVGRVLVVDDHEDFTIMLSAALSEFSQVHAANSVKSALSLLDSFSFDLAILDVNLNDGDAFDIAKTINAKGPLGPVMIFISGYDEPANRKKSWVFKAEDFVTKPFSLPEFSQKIQNKIANIMALRESYKGPFNEPNDELMLSLVGCENLTLNVQERKFLTRLIDYFVSHCADPNLRMTIAAKDLGYSRRSFQRLVANATNTSFSQLLKRFRTRIAVSLLKESYSIKEVARLCGFRSASYFSTKFKQEFGVTPRARRRELTERQPVTHEHQFDEALANIS